MNMTFESEAKMNEKTRRPNSDLSLLGVHPPPTVQCGGLTLCGPGHPLIPSSGRDFAQRRPRTVKMAQGRPSAGGASETTSGLTRQSNGLESCPRRCPGSPHPGNQRGIKVADGVKVTKVGD